MCCTGEHILKVTDAAVKNLKNRKNLDIIQPDPNYKSSQSLDK